MDGPVRDASVRDASVRDCPGRNGRSVFGAYCVDLVREQVSPSDFRQRRDSLPGSADDEDWGQLFEVVDGGGWSDPRKP